MRTVQLLSLLLVTACSSKGESVSDNCPDGMADDGAGNCAVVESDTEPDSYADDTGAGADADADADGGLEDCTATLQNMSPSDGETGVYFRDSVSFWLSETDSTAEVVVLSANGEPVAGSTAVSEEHVMWTPSANMTPDTDHTAILTWCGGEASMSFTTSETGAPLETDVTGETYALDLSTATWEEPAGIGSLLGDALNAKILVGVEEASDVIDFLIGIPSGDSVVQDFCSPTLDFDPISFDSSPFFEIGPADLPISMLGYSLTIYDMNINGTFQSDGSGMDHIRVSGSMDLRDLEDTLESISGGIVSDADSACDLVLMLGVACAPCPSDDVANCLSVSLTDIEATATGSELQVVEAAGEHPECEE